MNMKKIFPLAALTVLTGCTTLGQHTFQPKAISYEEASAFERSLLAQESAIPEPPEKLYIQPANKKEACKLPTSQDQLDRPNFRAYWDGECKNGFAFGLGRDIAISDTHHLEEITIHESGDNWSQPKVVYDYVNNIVFYGVGGSKFPATTHLTEKFDDSVSGFNAYQTLNITDESGKSLVLQTSAFHPHRIYFNAKINGPIAYRFTDNSAGPVANREAAIFTAEIVDLKSNTAGGVAIARYANGSVQHFTVADGKTELVSLPTNYVNHLSTKYQEILRALSGADAKLQRAQQIEREYLYKACNGKSGINGLDNATYTKICTWRDQFKEPYAIASANYQKKLENWKQQAATAEQQRQAQQQIALQQQMLQQRQNQQAWNEVNQAAQQLQQHTQQFIQGMNNWQMPQVQPLTPLGGDKVVCHTIGSITTCR